MSAIERRVDKLGRIVLPISYRQRLNLTENSRVNISMDSNMIIITPKYAYCALCGSNMNLHRNLPVCSDCIKVIKEL